MCSLAGIVIAMTLMLITATQLSVPHTPDPFLELMLDIFSFYDAQNPKLVLSSYIL